MKIPRPDHVAAVERLLRERPVVALLGARQVGKTTLAREIAAKRRDETSFDLEVDADRRALEAPLLALGPLRGLVVLDEIHHVPELFRALRVLADRPRTPARFLVLGSATPELLRQGSETLAGRIAFHHLGGFDLGEVGISHLERLWLRGSFPRAYLARGDAEADRWRRDFVRTFLERDLRNLGSNVPPRTLERFWTMLAHWHGGILNASEIGASLGVSHTTVRAYLDLLCGTWVVRELRPWSENVGKRVVRSPKVYVTDSGLLHTLLGIRSTHELLRHPKLGASWEGFLIAEVTRRLGARANECFFWRTHAGAELDLLVVRGGRRLGFEFKRSDAPVITPSMRSALETLRLSRLEVVHAGPRTYALARNVRALAARDLLREIPPLR